MSKPFDYSKWDKIELSDDEEDLHPNIDKDSWFRLKHRTRVEREEDEAKSQAQLEKQKSKLQDDLKTFGEAGKEHTKAKKIQKDIDEVQAKLDKMEKERKWNADNMCKTAESRTEINGGYKKESVPKPEPRLQGEEVAKGYCEFIEENEELLEKYIALGDEEDLEKVCVFLKEHGGTLLVGEHAESYLLLDCLEKEMNGQHDAMVKSARQNQLLTQLREFSRASQRPVRDAVHPIFQRLLDHEPTREAFDDSVDNFVKRVEKRAVVKKKEMDAEAASAEAGNPLGPGGLDPMEVLYSLPESMQQAFRNQDIAALQAAIEALPQADAKYHLRRCEDSGLWCPNPDAGPPPYQEDSDED
eukprot:TRINITY_DN75721_c0_g1_i1.p1 TRINITY_DN75721_c0_g1~~TRINITY_DN75721_c0_g1_i1.p1  ORF type:complete len:357 (-),score=107.64 TRINITY_DN75721_c0_g1_i1:252-1322(-)